jgi:hypothetical protein
MPSASARVGPYDFQVHQIDPETGKILGFRWWVTNWAVTPTLNKSCEVGQSLQIESTWP